MKNNTKQLADEALCKPTDNVQLDVPAQTWEAADPEKVDEVAKEVFQKYRAAFEELAK